jgi:hypothetical protein
MAETTAEPIQKEQTQPLEPPDKRPPGRPRAPRDVKADTGAGDVGESFFDSLKALTEQDWKDLYTIYLYRCEPYTDRKITGNDNFIMKYTQPIDQQSVMEEYGSGKYLAVLNLFNPTTRHGKSAYSHYFRIMNMNYPPKLPLGEWINDGRNKDWAWAKPLLEAAESRRIQQQQVAGTSAGMDQAAEMFKAAVNAVKQLRPEAAPEEQNSLAGKVIESMEKSADRMLAMANPAQFMGLVEKILSVNKSDGGGVVQLVMSQLAAMQSELSEERKFSRELLAKNNTPEPRRSLKEELGDVKEIAGMFRGNSAASSGTDWAGVLVPVVQKLLEVGGAVAQVAIARAGQKPPPRPAVTVQADHSLPEPAAPDAPQPQPANPNLTSEQQTMFMELELINATMGPMLDIATPHMVDMFHKATGMHFRDWFLDEYGDFSYRETKKLGPEKVLALFELRKQVAAPNVQQLLQQLQPPEKVQAFVLQFLSDEPAEEEDEDPEQPGTEDERKAVTKDF